MTDTCDGINDRPSGVSGAVYQAMSQQPINGIWLVQSGLSDQGAGLQQRQAVYDAQAALHIQAVNQAVAQRQNVLNAQQPLLQRPPEQTGNPWRLWNVDKPPCGKLVATVLEISPTVEIHRSDDLETEHQMWWRLA